MILLQQRNRYFVHFDWSISYSGVFHYSSIVFVPRLLPCGISYLMLFVASFLFRLLSSSFLAHLFLPCFHFLSWLLLFPSVLLVLVRSTTVVLLK